MRLIKGHLHEFITGHLYEMRYTIEQASDIGGVIRAARKAQNLRQDDAAGSVGVSESFMVKAERGAGSVQWGKMFQILQGLGVRVTLDIPDASADLLSGESAKANHRAAVRAFRAAERLAATAQAGRAPEGARKTAGMPQPLLKAAERLLATAAASRPAASPVVERARNLLGVAKPGVPAGPRKGTRKP